MSGGTEWQEVVACGEGPERCAVEVDEKWKHKHWRWQKMHGVGSDFLGVASVSASHR